MSLWSWKRGRRRHAANPLGAGCRLGSPPQWGGLPALPHKGLPTNVLFASRFSLPPFWAARHLCFLPGLSPLQTFISLPFSCPIYVPHRSLVIERYLWNRHIGLTRNTWKSPRFPGSGKSRPRRFLGHAENRNLLGLKRENQRAGVWHPGKSGDGKQSSLDAPVQPRERDAIYYGACYLGLVCSFPLSCLTLTVTPALHVLPTFCSKPA